MLDLLHFLHLLFGTLWAGGMVTVVLVIEPALLRQPVDRAAAQYADIGRLAGPLIGGAGALVLITGPLRAVLGGGIGSFGDLLRPYGLLVALAFLLTLVVAGFSDSHRARFRRALSAGASAADLRAQQRRHAAVTVVGISALLGIMTVLGLGLY